MKRRAAYLAMAAALLPLASLGADQHEPMLGFRAKNEQAQRELEKKFDAQLDPNDQRDWLQNMSSAPNHVGSPHDKANAEFTLAKFKEWGWDAHIETFEVLYPTPKDELLELVAPTTYKVKLQEPPIAGDRTSTQLDTQLPPYVAYGADGDVTAELVYVNYGMPDDYKVLARAGIDVKGKIVIARYGQGWRGLKPKLAQEHGAIGCIIYSDPSDDGYASDDTYPTGGARPAAGVQRGSVGDIPVRAGDPLTPNVGATKDAKRLPREKAETLLKIPVLPISYGEAQPLLAALGGQVTSRAWRGALPITYHFGPGPAKVHLAVHSDWSLKPIYDVIATMKGGEYPDQWIVRGNHRDGWVFGAWDPLSGHVAMMSEAKAIGRLVKDGWKPKRTLVYASWDGEEPGLLGSTEWAEAHAEELTRKAALYINSDSNARGFFQAGGTHSFQRFVNQIAGEVMDPETNISVRERLRARLQAAAFEPGAGESQRAAAESAAKGGDLPIAALGTGSDFTAFLEHLGIASLSLEYGGEDEDGGIYHSAYDSFDHFVRFGDPNFAYGIVMARTIGRAALRAADADILPHRFTDLAETVARYGAELHGLVDAQRKRAETLDKLLKNNTFKLASDPTKPALAPDPEAPAPVLELAKLDNAVERLKKSAEAYDAAFATAFAKDALTQAQLLQVNAMLTGIDRAQLDPKGLPGRSWYQSLLTAPGLATGYSAKTLPAVREAIEGQRWDEANQYAAPTAKALDAYSAKLDAAAALLK